MVFVNIWIFGVLLASLGCVRTQPNSVAAPLQSEKTLFPSGPLPRIILKCDQFTINPIIGEGGRVVRYRIDQQEQDSQSRGIKRFVEDIDFRKITHDLGQGKYAHSFSFKQEFPL